jgi:hypothetical protein
MHGTHAIGLDVNMLDLWMEWLLWKRTTYQVGGRNGQRRHFIEHVTRDGEGVHGQAFRRLPLHAPFWPARRDVEVDVWIVWKGDGNNSVCTNPTTLYTWSPNDGLYRTLRELANNFSPFPLQTTHKTKYNALSPQTPRAWLSTTRFFSWISY